MIRHYLVSGVVQGVGFRNFAQKRAEIFGLKGWVRNLQDGRVEVLASGEENLLEKFAGDIRRGPERARVLYLETKNVSTEDLPSTFEVRTTGVEPCVFG